MAVISKKNIFVTGGTGLVGSHFIEALWDLGANIIIPFRSHNPFSYYSFKKLYTKVVRVNMDINDFSKVREVVSQYEIDYIIHLAAQAIVQTAYVNPLKTLESNIIGTSNILEAARQIKRVKGVIVASSDKAYGKMKNKAYKETDPLRGDHPYEVSKSSADLIAQMYYKTYGLPVAITRFGNIYGPGDLNMNRLIPKLCHCIISKKIMNLRSDGTFRRDYLYVKDVVQGYILLLKKLTQIKGEVFNFGSPENLSVIEVIKNAENILNVKIPYKILNTQKNEIPFQSLNYQKVRKLLGWKPQYTLAKGLVPTFDWYKHRFAKEYVKIYA